MMNDISASLVRPFSELSAAQSFGNGGGIVVAEKQLSQPQQLLKKSDSIEVLEPPANDSNGIVPPAEELDKLSSTTITWYPAPDFLRLQDDLAYSFALAPCECQPNETDGLAYRRIFDSLTALLERHIAKANALIAANDSVPHLDDGLEEMLRVAIGRTRLLLNKRMKQFQEQLERHLKPIPGYKVTKLNDLHGLWALIDMQLEDIRGCFDQIEQCRLNGWVLAKGGDGGAEGKQSS